MGRGVDLYLVGGMGVRDLLSTRWEVEVFGDGVKMEVSSTPKTVVKRGVVIWVVVGPRRMVYWTR